MLNSFATPARTYAPGIGNAVADRTINRKITVMTGDVDTVPFEIPRRDDMALDIEIASYAKGKGYVISSYTVEEGDDLFVSGNLNVVGRVKTEDWADVAYRVALGNSLLTPKCDDRDEEFHAMHHHLRQASVLMSGRHLQHGDETQPSRNQEVFTNCSTAAVTFLSFYLLLNGSGVGRAYDDEMMLVDWANMPITVPVIDYNHKDVQSGEIIAPDLRTVQHLYAGRKTHIFKVPDSREGWAKAIEVMEEMAFRKDRREWVLILDFSDVRCRNSPIKGMQGRPASGPGALMTAIKNIALLRDAGMPAWRSAMYADHYVAECVLVGGARRAARMATKWWKDKSVLEFIEVKRGGFLWSSNNSVTVDAEFWALVKAVGYSSKQQRRLGEHAKAVFNAICECAYHDGTGEPGLINVDKLVWNNEGVGELLDGDFAESEKYKLEPETMNLTKALARAFAKSETKVITNPCGEIVLGKLGAYCVIGDVVPYHTVGRAPKTRRSVRMEGSKLIEILETIDHDEVLEQEDRDAEEAFRVTTRALIRTNLMDCLYHKEVARTNRIGVGMTGIHEYAWARFGYGWKDLVNERESLPFWLMLSRFKRAVQDEAKKYSNKLGVVVPHTNTTVKPAGTTSKLFGLTEGAHLPSMREYVRWVQFRNDDPLIEEYVAKGYPVRKLRTYSGTTIVGFPTQPTICALGMGEKLVTAGEATPEEQYEYLRLMEKYWIVGVEADGLTPLEDRGNQVSYTLKYKPELVSFEEFKRTLLEGQSTIRCCSVMPQTDTSAYEYQPEEAVNKHEFEMICNAIKDSEIKEDVDFAHIDCGKGGCPVEFDKED